MAMFLTIMEGDSGQDARPIMVIKDPEIIALVAQAIQDRLCRAADDGLDTLLD